MVLPPPVSINIRLVLMPFSQEPVSTQRAGCCDACASRGAVRTEGQGLVPGGWLLQHARRESAFSTARCSRRWGDASPRLLLAPRELPLPAARVCPSAPAGPHPCTPGADAAREGLRGGTWSYLAGEPSGLPRGFCSRARGKDKAVTPQSP